MKRNLWLRVYNIIQPYKGKLILSLISLLALTGLGLLPPIWGSKLVGLALPQGDKDLFIECVLVLVVLRVVSSLVSFAYSYQMRILGGRLVFDLRRRMYDHLQRLSLGFYESRSSGEIISRMMNDVNSVTSLVTGTVINTIIVARKFEKSQTIKVIIIEIAKNL